MSASSSTIKDHGDSMKLIKRKSLYSVLKEYKDYKELDEREKKTKSQAQETITEIIVRKQQTQAKYHV